MINLDVGRLVRRFTLRQAKREVESRLNMIGPERFQWLMENNSALSEHFSPQAAQALARETGKYAWFIQGLTQDEMRGLLPDWLHSMAASHGPQGQQWLDEQVEWLKKTLTGGL